MRSNGFQREYRNEPTSPLRPVPTITNRGIGSQFPCEVFALIIEYSLIRRMLQIKNSPRRVCCRFFDICKYGYKDFEYSSARKLWEPTVIHAHNAYILPHCNHDSLPLLIITIYALIRYCTEMTLHNSHARKQQRHDMPPSGRTEKFHTLRSSPNKSNRFCHARHNLKKLQILPVF